MDGNEIIVAPYCEVVDADIDAVALRIVKHCQESSRADISSRLILRYSGQAINFYTLSPTHTPFVSQTNKMPGITEQSLLSSNKSDSLIQVQLHPLVLLTVSDYVTRHALRQQKGPIVGAIIGTQDGRDVTMEHAFECKLLPRDDGEVVIDGEWFQDRLQQCT